MAFCGPVRAYGFLPPREEPSTWRGEFLGESDERKIGAVRAERVAVFRVSQPRLAALSRYRAKKGKGKRVIICDLAAN